MAQEHGQQALRTKEVAKERRAMEKQLQDLEDEEDGLQRLAKRHRALAAEAESEASDAKRHAEDLGREKASYTRGIEIEAAARKGLLEALDAMGYDCVWQGGVSDLCTAE